VATIAWGQQLHIGIIGCGIAGQACAIALTRRGHDVALVERFPQARPVGSGLLLQPSGQQALARLGLLEAALSWGHRVERLFGQTERGRMVMDLRYGDLDAGAFGLGIHRAALFDILHSALSRTPAVIHLDFEVASLDSTARPYLVAADGRREGPFDLVLDCAGAHDTLRDAFSSRLSAPLYPWGALWTTCRDRTGAFAGQLHQFYRGPSTMVGILPVGRMPDATRDDEHVAFFWSLKLADFERLRAEGFESFKTRVKKAWPDAAPVVEEIDGFDALSLASYRDVRLSPWHTGRILAMGDAAHGTSPQLGQGANLALIDAIVLADTLETATDIDAAIATYCRLRRSHVRFYQMASRLLTPFFQSDYRTLGFVRDLLLGPMGKLPAIDHVMRTTLAGVRRFPFGLYRPPPLSVGDVHAVTQSDRNDIGRVPNEK